jgi:hypothetical protein
LDFNCSSLGKACATALHAKMEIQNKRHFALNIRRVLPNQLPLPAYTNTAQRATSRIVFSERDAKDGESTERTNSAGH